MEANDKKRYLYVCDQTFEFFNILNLQYNKFREIEADIIFSDKNRFDDVIANVKAIGLFKNVYTVEVKEFERTFYQRSWAEQREIVKNPREHLEFPEFENTYTDIWINIDNIHVKLEYYNLVKLGMQPKIHFIQEGIGNYTRVGVLNEQEKKWEKFYGELAFSKNIQDNYIYRLSAFSGKDITNVELPKISIDNKGFCDLIEMLYGRQELPKEKFIFMENSLYDMQIMSNEIELFENLAKYIGKENIIVKRHPRNKIDRFTPLGYKVMEESNVPWEVILLENGDRISGKVVCSVFSQTLFSPFDVFGVEAKSIMLLKMLRHHVFWYEKKEWCEYVDKTIHEVNKNTMGIYLPESEEELREVARYCLLVGGISDEV